MLEKAGFDECVDQKLLRRIPPSKADAESSMKTAYKWLDESKKNIAGKAYNSALISSYTAMFHASRSLLFMDGFREKSHYCLARYLEENYVKKTLLDGKWVQLLDHYRDIRHSDQYGTNFSVTKDEAESALESASGFVAAINKLFESLD